MLGCIQPMSSPMMKRILGFCPCWAEAGMLAIVVAVHNTTRAPQSFLNRLMVAFLNVGCRCPGRSLRPTQRTDRVFAFWPIQDHASSIDRNLANVNFVEAPWMRYAFSAFCAY